MQPVHCQFILTFWPSAMKLWLSPWIFFGPLLGNYKWQLLHTFKAYKSALGPVHLRIILTFDLDIIIVTLKIISHPLLGNYKWQLLYIFRAYHTLILGCPPLDPPPKLAITTICRSATLPCTCIINNLVTTVPIVTRCPHGMWQHNTFVYITHGYHCILSITERQHQFDKTMTKTRWQSVTLFSVLLISFTHTFMAPVYCRVQCFCPSRPSAIVSKRSWQST